MTRNIVKASRGTGPTGLDDDKNGGNTDRRNIRGAVERKGKSTDKAYNEGFDVNN